jgi:outer membrane autotransporter protein
VFNNAVPSFRDRLLAGGPGAAVATDNAFASLEPQTGAGLELFASPFGGWQRQKTHDGYQGYDTDGSGIAVGAAKHWESFTLGAAAGYSRQRTEMTETAGRVDADIFHAAVFAGLRLGKFFLEAKAGYGRSWNDARRATPYGVLGAFAYSADSRQDILSASAGLGYVADLPCQFRLIPSITLDAVWVRSGGMTETGSLAALRLDGARYASVELPLSLMLEKRVAVAGTTLAPWVEAAWIPELGDSRPAADARFTGASAAGAFSAAAAAVRSRGRVAAGLRGEIGRTDLDLGYTMEFAGSYRNHTIQATIGMAF